MPFRPAQATTYAATRAEVFPGVDRPSMVLWLGLALIVATEFTDGGPIRGMFDAARGKQYDKNGGSFQALIVELALLAFLYLLALASDNSGTVAVLIVVALWAAWIVRHPGPVVGFFSFAIPKKGK